MRIIAGQYRGKNLVSPDSNKVRPTTDRVRESVFNILNSKLEYNFSEYSLLDLFSGTGAFALEAISRGINEVCMLDLDTQYILKNVALFPKEASKIKVIRQDATNLPFATKKYDLVFMDAPYKQGLSDKALFGLDTKNWLAPEAICMVEIEKKESLIYSDSFELIDERIYAASKVVFLKYLK